MNKGDIDYDNITFIRWTNNGYHSGEKYMEINFPYPKGYTILYTGEKIEEFKNDICVSHDEFNDILQEAEKRNIEIMLCDEDPYDPSDFTMEGSKRKIIKKVRFRLQS